MCARTIFISWIMNNKSKGGSLFWKSREEEAHQELLKSRSRVSEKLGERGGKYLSDPASYQLSSWRDTHRNPVQIGWHYRQRTPATWSCQVGSWGRADRSAQNDNYILRSLQFCVRSSNKRRSCERLETESSLNFSGKAVARVRQITQRKMEVRN